MRSHECLYLLFIDLKHNQSNAYSILLVAYGTTTKHVEHAISDWPDLEINFSAQKFDNCAMQMTTFRASLCMSLLSFE